MNVYNFFIGMPYDNLNQHLTTFPVATGVDLNPGDLVTHDNVNGSDKIVKVTDILTQEIIGVVDHKCTTAKFLIDPINSEKRYQVYIEGNICIEKPAGFDPDVGLKGVKIVRTGVSFMKRNSMNELVSVDGLVIKLK